MLTGNGHDVVSCSDGEEAILHFEDDLNTGARFDVVITDLGMPHMDGRTLASRIKELSPGTPVILLSGWGNFMSPDRGLPEDVDWVLGKPPTLARVLQVIRTVVVSANTPRPEEQPQ
jgi:DNA-binding response OmpR family regulator